MSFNRENIIWQSVDGTWNRGFYTVIEGFNSDDDDYDDEWDVDYDFGSFNWVTSGLATEKAAEQAWHGANPGGWSVVSYDPKDSATVNLSTKYDAMRDAFKNTQQNRKNSSSVRSFF